MRQGRWVDQDNVYNIESFFKAEFTKLEFDGFFTYWSDQVRADLWRYNHNQNHDARQQLTLSLIPNI